MPEKLNKQAFIANINECFTLLQTYEECYKEILDIIDALNDSAVTIETLQGLIEGSKYISFDVNESGTKLIINLDRTHIDTKPVNSSENLITSGGVASMYSANIDWSGNHTYDGTLYQYIDTHMDFTGECEFNFAGIDYSISAPVDIKGQVDITGNTTINGDVTLDGEVVCTTSLDVYGSISTYGTEFIEVSNSNTSFFDLTYRSGTQFQFPIFDLTYTMSGKAITERYRVLNHNDEGIRRILTDSEINQTKGLTWSGTQFEVTYPVYPLSQEAYDIALSEGTIKKDILYVIVS